MVIDEYEAVSGTPNTSDIAALFGIGPPFWHTSTIIASDGPLTARVISLDCNFFNNGDGSRPCPPHSVDGERIGYALTEAAGGSFRQIGAAQLAWVASTLAADTTSHIVIVLCHYVPITAGPVDFDALATALRVDNRPTIILSGHVHGHAYTQFITSAASGRRYTVYKTTGTLESGCYTRMQLRLVNGQIVMDTLSIRHYTDPGMGWIISPPFTLG